jgi:hypothetical protein
MALRRIPKRPQLTGPHATKRMWIRVLLNASNLATDASQSSDSPLGER